MIRAGFCILLFIYCFPLFSKEKNTAVPQKPSSKNIQKQAPSKKKSKPRPLTLKWEVSHPRNTDQISISFKENIVEFKMNASFGKTKPSLGVFQSSLTPKLKTMQNTLNQYHKQLNKTVSVLSIMKKDDPRLKLPPEPHAPVFYLNKEEIKQHHRRFQPLFKMMNEIMDFSWECVHCAEYQRKGKSSIVRTVKKISQAKKDKVDVKIQNFSTQSLDCVKKSKTQLECVDPDFGVFEI